MHPLLQQPTGTYLASLPTHAIVEPRDNPNRMSDVTYQRLRRAIQSEGLNSTVVVRDLGGGLYEIVDGCHRVRAARDLALEYVAAWVYPPGTLDDAKAKALQIGFNALTGEPDLTAVAQALAEYDLLGQGLLDLAGYGQLDAQALMAALEPVDLTELTMAPQGTGGDQEDTKPPKPFELTLAFESAAQLAQVRKVLRKAAGKGGDLAAGLLRVAGLDG